MEWRWGNKTKWPIQGARRIQQKTKIKNKHTKKLELKGGRRKQNFRDSKMIRGHQGS